MTREQLSYKLIDNGTGYLIYLDGTPWVKQDIYIPHPKETMEESAEAHIEQILMDVNTPPPEDNFEILKKQVSQQQEVIDQLLLSSLEV